MEYLNFSKTRPIASVCRNDLKLPSLYDTKARRGVLGLQGGEGGYCVACPSQLEEPGPFPCGRLCCAGPSRPVLPSTRVGPPQGNLGPQGEVGHPNTGYWFLKVIIKFGFSGEKFTLKIIFGDY